MKNRTAEKKILTNLGICIIIMIFSLLSCTSLQDSIQGLPDKTFYLMPGTVYCTINQMGDPDAGDTNSIKNSIEQQAEKAAKKINFVGLKNVLEKKADISINLSLVNEDIAKAKSIAKDKKYNVIYPVINVIYMTRYGETRMNVSIVFGDTEKEIYTFSNSRYIGRTNTMNRIWSSIITLHTLDF